MSRLREAKFADDERLVGRQALGSGTAADERDDLDAIALRDAVFLVACFRHHRFVDLDGDAVGGRSRAVRSSSATVTGVGQVCGFRR